jgi:hypothetical protein
MAELDDAFDYLHTSVAALQGGDRKACEDMLETAVSIFNKASRPPDSDRVIFGRYVTAIVNMLNEGYVRSEDKETRH